uniref:glutamine-rich protein 2 n=1 Tax=Scatophagus argus TaxID=75038 RepID=UPI001ED85C02|nr:glutamine-rich protein 2 [Scatophagus argus]
MSEENISLCDLLNLSIGTPQKGAVNFSALHALLHAVLTQLDIREMKTRWRDTPSGHQHPDAPVDVVAPEQDHHIQSSPSPTSSSYQRRLQSRVQTCEDDVSKAMKLIQELHNQKDDLKEELKELRDQQKMVGAQTETVTVVEKCCHRVDALEETVRSLRDSFQKDPEPQELSQCVTWDAMQSALLGDTGSPQKATFTPLNSHSPPPTPQPVGETGSPAAPISPREELGTRPPVLSGLPQRTHPGTGQAAARILPCQSGPERYPETVEALRSISKLTERFSELGARVAALEEGKVEQVELSHLRELLTEQGSQDAANNLKDQLKQQSALIDSLTSEREKDVQLLNGLQKAVLQLQAECENLHEDNRQKRSFIEELHKTTEELEEKKADRQMVESEMRADKCALDSKVSRLQFDSTTEQLNTMFHKLLNKVTGQEQDWHKVIDKLSTEMECKLNRIELDSVKKQLEGRWRNIHEKLQAQGAPEHEDAAALRKQLVDRFHCLSCDRPVVKYTSTPHLVKLPSTPGFPAHRSIRPFTVYALEQFRQHYRSERISELMDYSHLNVSRSCGGSHTVTSASQRRSGLQSVKNHTQTEGDAVTQSEEVDIVGLDGHIYKGRLNAPAVRNIETKLPTISSKDGSSKTKDKTKCYKPAASPDVGHGASLHRPHSARSVQCSRSASCSSGRDWPVSALGCVSHGSLAQASAAADSNTEPQADEPLDL